MANHKQHRKFTEPIKNRSSSQAADGKREENLWTIKKVAQGSKTTRYCEVK